ncbi:kinase, partial [Thraustotheca clavata]
CIVNEFSEGQSLFSILHNPTQNLTWKDNLLQCAIDICEGMLYLHTQHTPILHRALRSQNIWISYYFCLKSKNTAKINFLDLACISADLPITRETEAWIAPEILTLNPNYSEKSDVYSFGIVLWEMATCAIPRRNGDESPAFPSNTMPIILEDLYYDCVSEVRPDFAFILNKLKTRVHKAVESQMGPYPVLHSPACNCSSIE